jgi:hypothetical protein
MKEAGRGFGVLRDNHITIPFDADKVKCGKHGV